MKAFACFFLFGCYLADASHIATFRTHQVTENFRGCHPLPNGAYRGAAFNDIWPDSFNSTYVYSIDMCMAVPGEPKMCSDNRRHRFEITWNNVDLAGTYQYSTVPNGVTTEYCFTSYACRWLNEVHNFAILGLNSNGVRQPQLVVSFDEVYVDVPPATPIEYSARAATFKIETTEDIYLVDGYRVFDIYCDLKDCLITADTENGGSGTTQDRIKIKASENPDKTPYCLPDGDTLEDDESYLITFTCDEVCPKKLKVSGTIKETKN